MVILVPPPGIATCGDSPISELQEYVQSDKRYSKKLANRPVLRWELDQRLQSIKLEFRATVSFVLHGVPHHATGAWLTSKKAAQRDAAERVLIMLKNQWIIDAKTNDRLWRPTEKSAVEELSDFVSHDQKASPLEWRCIQSEGGWQAMVEVCIFGDALHTLQGAVCKSEEKAYEDTAARALWYLKAPSHVNAFEVSHLEVDSETLEPPKETVWLREGMTNDNDLHETEEQIRAADQKTRLMRTQNELQKRYGKLLPAGTPVWTWTFESRTEQYLKPSTSLDECCRARVWIAGLNQEILGDWCDEGQKAAQLKVCEKVEKILEVPWFAESSGEGYNSLLGSLLAKKKSSGEGSKGTRSDGRLSSDLPNVQDLRALFPVW